MKKKLKRVKAWTAESAGWLYVAVVDNVAATRKDERYTLVRCRTGSVIGKGLTLKEVKAKFGEKVSRKAGRKKNGEFAERLRDFGIEDAVQARKWKCGRVVAAWTCPACDRVRVIGGHRCKEPTCRATVCCQCFLHDKGLCGQPWCQASETYMECISKPAKREKRAESEEE